MIDGREDCHRVARLGGRERCRAALQVVVNVTRCIALKRALVAANPDPTLNFWRVLHGNLLDIAVLDWCKLFGSGDEQHQQVHWKSVFSNQDAFRAGLLAHVHMDLESWRDYWWQLKTYRDQRVAHLDFDRRDITHYPDLEPALLSVSYYYSQLISELQVVGGDELPNDLSAYYSAFLAQARKIAAVAIESTSEFAELGR